MLSKICTYCNKTFYSIKIDGFAKHFHKAKLGKFGFASVCKVCRAEQNKKYNKKRAAKKEKTRKNKMKPYTKQEEEFIMQNRGLMKLRDIAKKLNRTTRGIILKITQLKVENEN